MINLGLHSKYGIRHGEERRAERRKFATEKAGALAKAGMAEVERRQTGQTRRTKMRQEGMDKRQAARQAAIDKRAGLAAKQGGGLRGAGGGTGGGADSTRMKSFDFANKAMSERYPDRINPVTNKPFSPEAWNQRLTELADSREAYGGFQPTGEQQPVSSGMQGRGRVVTEGGRQFDVTPGGEGFQESRASSGMMGVAGFSPRAEAAGSLPQVPANRFAQIAAMGAQNKAPAVPEIATSTAPTALEAWEKKYPRRKKIKGAMGGEFPTKTFMRSLTKPIDRSRLGRQYDYMSRFGSQQGYNR